MYGLYEQQMITCFNMRGVSVGDAKCDDDRNSVRLSGGMSDPRLAMRLSFNKTQLLWDQRMIF